MVTPVPAGVLKGELISEQRRTVVANDFYSLLAAGLVDSEGCVVLENLCPG